MRAVRRVSPLVAMTAAVAVALLFVPGALAEGKPGGQRSPEWDGSTILVKFADQNQGAQDVRGEGDEVAGKTAGHALIVRLRGGANPAARLAAYRGRAGVVFAEPNYLARATLAAPNDSSYGLQWAFPKIQALSGWALDPGSYTGSGGVPIAVVDTGVDSAHPDLSGRVDTASGANCVNSSDTCLAGSAMDDYGHGTHVAGIAGAATNNGVGVAGTAFSSPIIPVKVLNASGSGSYAAISNGILWAAQHGARVISLSLGGYGYSQTLCDAVTTAETTYQALVVAAAGNDGVAQTFYPAACPGVVGVAATDSSDGSPTWSNYGAPDVFVSAPGANVYSTCAASTSLCNYSSYAYLSGTSMATPFVSGLAALLFGQVPGRTVNDVKSVLRTTADHVGGVSYGSDPYGTCGGCWHDWYGYGRINLARALGAATPPPPPSSVTLASISLNPTSVTAGSSSQGTVTLSAAAPTGGAGVALSSSNTAVATVPATVVVPAGQTSAGFGVSTLSVASATPVTISGSYGGSTQSATLTVTPVSDADFTLSVSPGSRTVRHGRSTSYSVSISWGAGVTGPVSLSVSGLPFSASASFSPNPTSSSTTLTVHTSWSTRGSYQLTVTGIRGSRTHTAAVMLTVT